MYKVEILPSAMQDIKESAEWYDSQKSGLGRRFTREIRENVLKLSKNPSIWAIRYDDVHTAVLTIFPFMIHYTVDSENELVIVWAVLHTSRNPGVWED